MPPLSLLIKPVSGLCQMRCAYCFYADEMRARGSGVYAPMGLDTLEALVRRAFIYADGQVHFGFQGGEPTLAGADFYRALLAFERKYNSRLLPVHHALQTNGYDVSDDMIAVLRAGRFLVGLSLDGTCELHDRFRLDAAGRGTWHRALDTAGRLQAAGVPFNILCVVDEDIARHGRDVFEALAPYGYVQFIPRLDALDGSRDAHSLTGESYGQFLIDTYDLYSARMRAGQYVSVRTLDNSLRLLQGLPPDSCAYAGQCAANWVVESDGTVYPCDFYALDPWNMGNVRTDSFRRISRSAAQQAFLKPDPLPPECRACAYAALCRNGCRRERREGKTFLCQGIRRFLDARLEDMKALVRSGAVERAAARQAQEWNQSSGEDPLWPM